MSENGLELRAEYRNGANHVATGREFVIDESARAHLSTWESLYDIRENSEIVWSKLHIRQG